MKFWQEGLKNTSRIILLLLLLLFVGLGIFLGLQSVLGASPLQKLAARDVQWIAVARDPSVLASLASDKDILTETTAQALLPQLLPGANREAFAKVLASLPVDTVLAEYPSGVIAVFSSSACDSFAHDALQASLHNGLCVLHTSSWNDAWFDTSEGSLRSVYGPQLPDNPAAVQVLLTPHFPFGDVVSSAWGNSITPEAMLARALVSKNYPVAATIDKNTAGDMHLVIQVLMDVKQPVPQQLQDATIAAEALRYAPAQGPFVVLPLSKDLPEALTGWLTTTFGEDVARMANHEALSLTEQLTPVGINPALLPSATVLLTGTGANMGAVFTGLDADGHKHVQESVTDALTFLYGIKETATTLPDKSRGVLVTASMDAIAAKTETMSGATVTTYTAKDAPRLVMVEKDDTTRLAAPGAMTGTILTGPQGTTQQTPWHLPVDMTQSMLMRYPLDSGRSLYAGFLFLRDRLRFDIVLTARS